jgi:hypothetical protein
VFVTGPAALVAGLTPAALNKQFWVYVIFAYYLLATFLPIDKLIGKIYPIFGLLLLIMAIGVIGGIFIGGYKIPEITLANLHPKKLPIWPLMFITIASARSPGSTPPVPIMARCLGNDKHGRAIFYGAMIAEASSPSSGPPRPSPSSARPASWPRRWAPTAARAGSSAPSPRPFWARRRRSGHPRRRRLPRDLRRHRLPQRPAHIADVFGTSRARCSTAW